MINCPKRERGGEKREIKTKRKALQVTYDVLSILGKSKIKDKRNL